MFLDNGPKMKWLTSKATLMTRDHVSGHREVNKCKILNCGKKRTFAWWPEGKKARKVCQKAMMAFGRVVFRFYQPDKEANNDFRKNISRRGKEGTFLESGLSASRNTQWKRESDDWSSSHRTDDSWSPDVWWSCSTRPIGSRSQSKFFKNMHGLVASQQKSAFFLSLSCSSIRRQKFAWRVAISIFRQHNNVLLWLMCLKQVMCPSCFLSLRWKNCVWQSNRIQKKKKRQNNMSSFWSRVGCSTMGRTYCVGLTNLACQSSTKSREQSDPPEMHVLFAVSVRTSSWCIRHA